MTRDIAEAAARDFLIVVSAAFVIGMMVGCSVMAMVFFVLLGS